MEDKEIIALYQSRDEAAVERTAEKYGQRLRRISYGITEDDQTAEECENDTYLEAWNAIPPQNPSDYLFAYLARIVRHISIDVCRSRRRLKRNAILVELTAEMEECIPAPDDAARRVEYQELGRLISRWLYTLSEEKQVVFIQRYWYLSSVSDIAKKLGMGQSRVKMTLLRCRNGLREYLEKEGWIL